MATAVMLDNSVSAPEPSIAVSRDYRNIRRAALELFEEALIAEELERALDKFIEREAAGGAVANRERALESLRPKPRSLAEGYYVWAAHLFDLELSLQIGFKIGLADLRATELAGLRIVKSARREFENTHPACGKCGTMNTIGALRCRKCGEAFGRKR